MFRKLMRHERWASGIVNQSVESIARVGFTSPIHWFGDAKRWIILADPSCMVLPDGRQAILVERLNVWTDRGEIWAAVIRPGGDLTAVQFRPWLIANFHLSYPFPFLDGKTPYLMCESWEAGGLFLWRHDGDWKLIGKILDRPAVDATIWRGSDCWWLFCGIAGDQDTERLHIFFADQPEGPWHAHPKSPAKSDSATSRPAGPLFMCDGMLIRPAQDCSQSYGGGITLNVVTTLNRTTFDEHVLRTLLPPHADYPHGLHTICQVGDLTLIDGRRWDFHPLNVARKLWLRPVQQRMRRGRKPVWPDQLRCL